MPAHTTRHLTEMFPAALVGRLIAVLRGIIHFSMSNRTLDFAQYVRALVYIIRNYTLNYNSRGYKLDYRRSKYTLNFVVTGETLFTEYRYD